MTTRTIYNVTNEPTCMNCGNPRQGCECQKHHEQQPQHEHDDALIAPRIVDDFRHANRERPEIITSDGGDDSMLVAPTLNWRNIAANRNAKRVQPMPVEHDEQDNDILIPPRIC